MTAPDALPEVLKGEELRRHYSVARGPFLKPATLKALDGVSFSLRKSETLAVVGESGCGKSTLARLLTMIEAPTSGKLTVDGISLSDSTRAVPKADRQRVRTSIQMIFQDPFGSLNPRKKIGTILEEPLIINTALSSQDRRERALSLMARVGLRPEHYNRYPHMFSGGQRQRIAIARALMLQPKIVVADEPVSALDLSIQAQVLNLLLDLQEAHDLAYVFISHDLTVVEHVANAVLVMYLGRPVEQGESERIFSAPLHPYTRALLSATPRVDQSERRDRVVLQGELPSPLSPPTGCAFHTRCPHAKSECATDRPEPRHVDGRLVACHFAGEI
jgi:dipeptide transport system ATP-binding protein